MLLNEETIKSIVHKIKEKTNPLKIIVFGSYAYGKPKPNSDLDLLIIKDNINNKRKELVEIKKGLISKDYSLDILLYSKEEYNQKLKEGWSILENIQNKGIAYYG